MVEEHGRSWPEPDEESGSLDRPAHPKRVPDIIAQIKAAYDGLRPAERRVADVVLDEVRFAVDASNAELARRAEVSEPTVTRFCRAIGCEGVRDFKLKLAQSLVVGGLYLAHPPESQNDNGMPFWGLVFSEARHALDAVEREIDPDAVRAAAELVANAGQVLVFGMGGSSSALAAETQNRLFRYGVTVSAYSDPYLMRMTASTLKPGDLVIAISATGRTPEVVEAVELARHYRAKAICMTAPASDLSRVADIRLTVSIPEYPDTLKPTASRFAFLAIIDLVSVAVGYRLGGAARETLRRIKYTVLSHREGTEHSSSVPAPLARSPDQPLDDDALRVRGMLEKAPSAVATQWLASFSKALATEDVSAVTALFLEESYWRDLLTFTWNIETMEGKGAIAAMLQAALAATKPHGFALKGEAASDGATIEAWFTFETEVARGEGILRLRDGKCWTILTAMTELKGFEEKTGPTRPLGIRHQADRKRETWLEARERETTELGHTRQPFCLVIGGGQGGIALGARLKQIGVPAIVVEKNARAGDSWRKRYRSLVLHDPVWYDHMPYIPFPDHWPVFTPKDKMGDWLEMYAKVMELDYWTSTTCVAAAYDDKAKEWTVTLERDGEEVTLKPKTVVFATGAYGPPRRIEVAGTEDFKGEILHSSDYSDGRKFKGKKVVVIGSASSGHDVSVDLWEAGADVTMVQRSPTTVVRSDTLMELAFEIYSESAVAKGITVDVADMLVASTPFALLAPGQRQLYETIRARDADFYARLGESGLALDFGDDETGLMMKAYRTGSGYYIDVGASELIMKGEIKVKSGVEIASFTPSGLRFEDGEELPADVVIFCTGYHSMHEVVAEIVSREVADRIGPCWGLGSGVRGDPGPWHGEPRNMWKPTAQEALWFHGGNLALSRFYSKFVALQLKARLEGIQTPVYRAAKRNDGPGTVGLH